MTDVEKVSIMVTWASFFEPDEEKKLLRIIGIDDDNEEFFCGDDDGWEYRIPFKEVDLAKDKFYKSVVMDPKDY